MEQNILKAMPWFIAMAVAFIGFVVFGTILIVKSKKRMNSSHVPDAYDDINRVQNAAKATGRRQIDEKISDKILSPRDAIYRSQTPNRTDFGFTLQNPVITSSLSSSEAYLGTLRTDHGEPVTWIRTRTVRLNDLNGAGPADVDEYVIYLHGRDSKKRIYICPEGKNSLYAPDGFVISSDKKPTRYNGSIAREAQEKGITTEQVLAKHAFVYENAQKQRQPAPQAVTPFPAKPAVRPAEAVPAPRPAMEGIQRPVAEKPAAQPSKIEPFVSGAHEKKHEPVDDHKKTVSSAQQNIGAAPAASEFSSLPKYLPGFEPENVRIQLDKFFSVINKAYPDGIVYESTWDHAHWDNAAGMLCRYLGYARGSEFLEAYGYTFIKS